MCVIHVLAYIFLSNENLSSLERRRDSKNNSQKGRSMQFVDFFRLKLCFFGLFEFYSVVDLLFFMCWWIVFLPNEISVTNLLKVG